MTLKQGVQGLLMSFEQSYLRFESIRVAGTSGDIC